VKRVRCAIYTRKSSEEGLEQEFNSLHAQREACVAYIASQKHEGWVLMPGDYDDGGLSGGSLERPALQRLLDDVRSGKVDQIVVYKIDRLTRSLADFAKIVDVLDAAGASFVSVTQSFNTATSMGRLTLNMLLSFAQFEREVTAERIRDKIAASKRKGLWMGGLVPLGYDADGRTLKINTAEAQTVRAIYDLYERLGTIREVTEEAGRLALRTRRRETDDGKTTGGNLFQRGHIHHILTNPLDAGRIRHRDRVHEGQHPALIEPERWDRIQALLQDGATRQRGKASARRRSLLCGKIFDETGDRLTPSHAKTRAGIRLRYYISRRLVERSGEAQPGAWRLPADELEARVADLVQQSLSRPGVAATLLPGATAETIATASEAIDAFRVASKQEDLLALVDRIDIAPGTLTLRMSPAAIAERLSVDEDAIDVTPLTSSHPFRHRKRGVETKLILADAPACRDEALIRNIARAHLWFECIRAGQTFDEIARSTGASKRRIQHMIGLAFMAPDIVRDTLDGRQPAGFTSDWCRSHELPSDWAEQRALLATL
jgi:YD repeat-containing protein